MDRILSEKGIPLEEHQRILEEREKRIQKLEESLASLSCAPDERIADAREALATGDPTKAIAVFKDCLLKKDIEKAAISADLGNAYYVALDFPKSLAAFQEAARLEPDNWERHNAVGRLLYDLGRPRETVAALETALACLPTELKEPGGTEAATLWNNLGEAYRALGEPRKAIEYFVKAQELVEKAFGPEHPHVAATNNNIGAAYDDLGEPRKAIEYYERALASDLKSFGAEHPKVATRYNNLGGAYDALGEPRKAIEYYEKAQELVEKAFGPEHPHVAATNNNIGEAYRALGEPRKAIEYYEKALAVWEKAFGPEHPQVATANNNLGGAYHAMGDTARACGYFRKAHGVILKAYGPGHPYAKDLANKLAGCPPAE